MSRSIGAPGGGVTRKVDEPAVTATRGFPLGRAGDIAAATLVLASERDRIAVGMNDIVLRRLFSAGLLLETALGLMGHHPAGGKVQEAIGELDLAIRDFRNVLFDHCQPESTTAGVDDRPLAACESQCTH